MTTQLTHRLAPVLGIALAVATFSHAWAQDSAGSKTREEVRAELFEAQRSGDIMAGGETGKLLNEINPSAYPAKPAAQGLTRAQVMAELAEAQRRGDIIAGGDSARTLKEVFPGAYSGKTVARDLHANR